MSKVVLDASAVLAVLNQEKGSEAIAQLMDDAIISSVNLSEVVAKLYQFIKDMEEFNPPNPLYPPNPPSEGGHSGINV